MSLDALQPGDAIVLIGKPYLHRHRIFRAVRDAGFVPCLRNASRARTAKLVVVGGCRGLSRSKGWALTEQVTILTGQIGLAIATAPCVVSEEELMAHLTAPRRVAPPPATPPPRLDAWAPASHRFTCPI